jgi:hypothetical protein
VPGVDWAGVDWAGVNRPAVIRARPAGKGLNVARTLLPIGAEVQVIGLAGAACPRRPAPTRMRWPSPRAS